MADISAKPIKLTPARRAVLRWLAGGWRLIVCSNQSGLLRSGLYASEIPQGIRAATLKPLIEAGLIEVKLPGNRATLTEAGKLAINKSKDNGSSPEIG